MRVLVSVCALQATIAKSNAAKLYRTLPINGINIFSEIHVLPASIFKAVRPVSNPQSSKNDVNTEPPHVNFFFIQNFYCTIF